jgi:hypothetical protein|tara:strand:- start:458 stop:901 length:444 start_codon:yes stop_codon:yes gene_type:complete
MNEVEMALKRPFPVNKIKWRPGGGGKDLCYIDARDVMDRLDQVFGMFGWQTNYEFMGGRMICNLSVRFDSDYESGKSEWITKSDGSDDTNIEGEKGGISGALKRSAVLLGIGRYLYNPNAFNSNREPASWATPEGFDELMEKRNVSA